MRAVIRRIRRLEESLKPVVDQEPPRWVAILRERRRRRAEAEGKPFDDRLPEPVFDEHGSRLTTWAETLRARRAQRCAEPESRLTEKAEQTQ